MDNKFLSTSRSLLVASASSIAIALFSTYLIISRKKLHIQDKDEAQSISTRKPRLPPMANTGMIKTILELGSSNAPWFLLKTAKEIKSYVFRLRIHQALGCPMFVVVAEPNLAREVYMDPLSFRPEKLYKAFEGVALSPSIFTRNGKFWHSRRKGMAPAFSSKHIKRMNKVASGKAEEWIKTKLETFVKKDEAFDVGKEMISITLSTISEAAFEYDMSDDEKEMFVEELELCLREFCGKAAMNPLRVVFGLLLEERRRAHIAARRIQSLSLSIIHAYKNLPNPTKDTLIDCIMNNDAYENDAERAADITILLIAGHDTTAFSIAWILKELAKNPIEQQKLRESLILTERKDWGQLETLHNVVKEGMRLFPVAGGGNVRCIGRDIQTDDGLLLKKGSIISIPGILINRNTNVFENAESFIPSRWDKPTKEMNDSRMNFSLGKQNCVGQSLANAEIHTLIPLICSRFELEIEDEGSIHYSLTLKPRNLFIKAKKVRS